MRFILFLSALLLNVLPAHAAEPVIRIGTVCECPGPEAEALHKLLIQEVLTLTKGEFDVRFPADNQLAGEGTLRSVTAAADRLLADPAVDIVVAMDVISTHYLAHRPALPKPVIGAAAVDITLQELPYKDGTSGKHNLNYTASFRHFERDVAEFSRLTRFSNMAVLVDALILETIPALQEKADAASSEMGFRIQIVPVAGGAGEALAALPDGVDAVFVTPLRLDPDNIRELARGLIDRRLPSFAMAGRQDVELGLMAGLTAEEHMPHLIRRIALNVQRVLLGENASALPVELAERTRLTVNMATVRAIDKWPPWNELIGAEQLFPHAEPVRTVSLSNAVTQAVAANLDLVAAGHDLAAGAEQVKEARSALLPQASASAARVQIDADRARIGSGLFPETTTQAAASVSQLVYSDTALAAHAAERHLQRGRVADYETIKLDLAHEAATVYLNLLKAKTLERVREENVHRTTRNLELARARRSLGQSGPADVHRWESELATDRKELLQAQAQRFQAEVALNRLLHLPLESPFATVETGLDDPTLRVSDQRFLDYVTNQRQFDLFRDFMAQEALEAAPEIRSLDAAVLAQERAVKAAWRAYFAPTVVAKGELTETLDRGGDGVVPLPANDTDWTLTLAASIPLATGGERGAALEKAKEELAALQVRRSAAAEAIQARVRVALHATGATYPGIGLSEEAARAAAKNLEIVTDGYERGAVSIIDLLDAQNAALVAQLSSANAVYDFLLDLMEVQRAAGQLDFFLSPAEREAWFARMDSYYRIHGITPGP